MQVAMRSHHLTWINLVLIFGLSIACWFPALYGLSSIPAMQAALPSLIGIAQRLYRMPTFWLAVGGLAPAAALLVDFLHVAMQRQWLPPDYQIFQVN